MQIQPATVSELARSITRPLLTMGALGSWSAFIFTGRDYPEAYQWLTMAMCLEWFTERAVRRFKELRGRAAPSGAQHVEQQPRRAGTTVPAAARMLAPREAK